MKIGVIGGGVVGHATARVFMEHADVMVYDTDPVKATHGLTDTIKADIIFVCLPTPQSQSGYECDTKIIEDFFGSVTEKNLPFVIRSTVPVGFTRKMAGKYGHVEMCHSPEFLTARCAVADAHIPSRNIVGIADPYRPAPALWSRLVKLYQTRFPGVQTITMLSDESELVKLGTNSFFASKLAWWNELHQYCVAIGVDFQTVREGILADGRIAHSHTQVPGPDGKCGFGGACLPKDINNLVACMMKAGVPSYVNNGASLRNTYDRSRPAQSN